MARHQFTEAIRWGERSLAINAYKARTLGVIGDGQLELGRYDEAFATFQRMVDLRPDLSSYARVAYARELIGDVDGAIAAMEDAVQAGAPYGENTAYVQVQLGHLSFNAGRLDEAEAAYQKAMRLYPNYKYAQAGVARVVAARGDLPRAIALLTDVVDVMPLPEFVIALSDLYRAAGQPAEAAKQDDLVRAMSALYQTNGVDLNIELAMFEAERGLKSADRDRARARGPGRASEHQGGRRPGLGALSVRPPRGGPRRQPPGAPARHAGRAAPLPGRHDRRQAR